MSQRTVMLGSLFSNLFSGCHFHHRQVWWTCLLLCLLHLRLLSLLPSPQGRWAGWQTRQRSTGSGSSPAGRGRRSRQADGTGWRPRSEPSWDLSGGTWAHKLRSDLEKKGWEDQPIDPDSEHLQPEGWRATYDSSPQQPEQKQSVNI